MPSSYPYSSGGNYGTSSKYGTSSSAKRCDHDDLDSAYESSSKTSSLYGGSSSKYDGSDFDTDYDYKRSGYKSKYGAMPYDYEDPMSYSSESSYSRSKPRPDYERTVDASSRSISPPRSDAERPRRQYSYSDYRSVSPLGSSRFEKRADCSSWPLGRSSTIRETPTYGDDGYFGKSDTTSGFKGAGLSRSNAVRGRGLSATNARGFGSSTGYSSSSRYGSSSKNYGTNYDLY